jgi:hypothetical protein
MMRIAWQKDFPPSRYGRMEEPERFFPGFLALAVEVVDPTG